MPALHGVYDYRVWRSVPPQAAAFGRAHARITRDAEVAALTGQLLEGPWSAQGYAWEMVGSLAATQQSAYATTVATTGDQVPGSNPYTVFMVQARATSGGSPFWYSLPDSGFSIDNLPPGVPNYFAGSYASGSATLTWSPNPELDLAGYRLYRGTSPSFVPGPGSLVIAKSGTGYVDNAGQPYVYKLTAADQHGNESVPATVNLVSLVGLGGSPSAHVLALAAPRPNPARGAATLGFTLTRAGAARLTLFDAGGRRVRSLFAGTASAGEHVVTFSLADHRGRSLASGLYLVRLEAEGRTLTRRVEAIR
jgi:hypothetical protein